MKRIFTLIAVLLTLSFSVRAQTTALSVQLINPAVNSTINSGVQFNIDAVITVVQGSIGPSDSLIYQDFLLANLNPAQIIRRTNLTKNVNDTIQISFAGTMTGSDNTFDYCAIAYVQNGGLASDTSLGNWEACNSVNLSGFATNVENVFKVNLNASNSLKMNVSPNPATTNVKFDFVAQSNTEVYATVYDLTGRKVLSHNYGKAFKGQNGFGLDIAELNTGMYIVELRQGNLKATGRLIK